MNNLDEKNKKVVANEIVMIFKKLKLSLFLAIFWFASFSVYNELVAYSIFNKQFAWFEAEEILGIKPSQYNFVAGENQNAEFGAPTYGSMEISDEDYLIVKKEIIRKLLEDSITFSLIMIPITFGILLIVYYANKVIKWTKKYSD